MTKGERKRRGRGEGSIYQRTDGLWCASVRLSNGKRKTFYGQRKQDVQEKLKVVLRDQQLGLLAEGPRQTVEQYLSRWLEDNVKHSVKPRTYDAYALNVRRLSTYIGKRVLGTLSPAAVQSAYGSLLDKGLSRRSVEQAHAVLHRALRQAVQWALLGRNPADAVSVPRPKRHEMQTLTAEQVKQLFAVTAEDRLHALWVLLITTGLRLGEALGLQWQDVDLNEGRLVVRQALQRQVGRGLVFVEPKTDKSRRTVHLANGTVAALKEHRLHQVEERLQAGSMWEDRGIVFCGALGNLLDPARASEALHRALVRAGLPNIRVHDLRHTAATLLLTQGVHPKVVQELLGHSTITLTLDTYSHVAPALHAEVATRMNTLFGSEK